MTHPESDQLQSWLDGELDAASAARLERHVATCAECAADLASYRRIWSELATLPLLDPRPELYARIIESVLPARVLPRWVRVLGWAYAGALATSLAAIGSAFVLPGPSAWLHGVIAAGMRSLTSTGTFVLRTLSDGFAKTGETLAGGGSAGRLLKLLGGALAHPVVFLTVLAALAACALLLWWMRPREQRERGGLPDVGLLGLF
jgi:hypothetical protein